MPRIPEGSQLYLVRCGPHDGVHVYRVDILGIPRIMLGKCHYFLGSLSNTWKDVDQMTGFTWRIDVLGITRMMLGKYQDFLESLWVRYICGKMWLWIENWYNKILANRCTNESTRTNKPRTLTLERRTKVHFALVLGANQWVIYGSYSVQFSFKSSHMNLKVSTVINLPS